MAAPSGPPDPPPASLPAVGLKRVVAAFHGGRTTSNGGVMLFGAVERQLGIADIRGNSPHGPHAVVTWREANGLHHIFGLSGNALLDRMLEPIVDNVTARRGAGLAKRVRIAFAAGCPDADQFSGLVRCFQPAGP